MRIASGSAPALRHGSAGLLRARRQILDVAAFSGVNPAGCVTALAAFCDFQS